MEDGSGDGCVCPASAHEKAHGEAWLAGGGGWWDAPTNTRQGSHDTVFSARKWEGVEEQRHTDGPLCLRTPDGL